VFAASFLLLLAAAAAVGVGQFVSGTLAPWVSIACSACAAILTIAALLMRPDR
jgi:hypothetical protein